MEDFSLARQSAYFSRSLHFQVTSKVEITSIYPLLKGKHISTVTSYKLMQATNKQKKINEETSPIFLKKLQTG
jgi:hypothetical protein